MLIFFGTRVSVIKQERVEHETTCPNCQAKHSFISYTLARYFHIFWIPFIPLGKSNVIICSSCDANYKKHDFTDSIVSQLNRQDELNPPRRPIWHGCGCLLIVGFVLLSFIFSLFSGSGSSENEDARIDYLNADFDKMTTDVTAESDSISFVLKECINLDIEGINTENIGYYSRVNENRILVLLKVRDMKGVEPSSRKNLVYAVEECLDIIIDGTYVYYIGVDGNWNLLMSKSPYGSDLGGKYGNRETLLPFYDNFLIEEDTEVVNDSIPIE